MHNSSSHCKFSKFFSITIGLRVECKVSICFPQSRVEVTIGCEQVCCCRQISVRYRSCQLVLRGYCCVQNVIADDGSYRAGVEFIDLLDVGQ